MLKKRIIGLLVVKNNWVVQSIKFERYHPVGRLDVAVEYLDNWGIDEIVILDIDATHEKRSPNYSIIKSASKFSQTPLSVGGGISSIEDIESLLKIGVDKVVINSKLISNPNLIKEAAYRFGSQCMVASIDAVKIGNNYNVKDRFNKKNELNVIELARKAEDYGAGEIFLNSVDRDGMKIGLDLVLASQVRESVDIPIILCGGVGKPSHLIAGVKSNIDAVAAGNFFHYTEMSVIAAKQFMLSHDCRVRLDTYANYKNANFDDLNERPIRLNEDILEKLRFEFIPEEKI